MDEVRSHSPFDLISVSCFEPLDRCFIVHFKIKALGCKNFNMLDLKLEKFMPTVPDIRGG